MVSRYTDPPSIEGLSYNKSPVFLPEGNKMSRPLLLDSTMGLEEYKGVMHGTGTGLALLRGGNK
jgi:hypothetical protein